jgi:hypothetical protein
MNIRSRNLYPIRTFRPVTTKLPWGSAVHTCHHKVTLRQCRSRPSPQSYPGAVPFTPVTTKLPWGSAVHTRHNNVTLRKCSSHPSPQSYLEAVQFTPVTTKLPWNSAVHTRHHKVALRQCTWHSQNCLGNTNCNIILTPKFRLLQLVIFTSVHNWNVCTYSMFPSYVLHPRPISASWRNKVLLYSIFCAPLLVLFCYVRRSPRPSFKYISDMFIFHRLTLSRIQYTG